VVSLCTGPYCILCAHRSVLCQLDLLRKAHQEHVRPLGNPFLVQLLFSARSLHIVRRLEALQQSRKRGVHFGWENRHVGCLQVVDLGSGPGERLAGAQEQGIRTVTLTMRRGSCASTVVTVTQEERMQIAGPLYRGSARCRLVYGAGGGCCVKLTAQCFGGAKMFPERFGRGMRVDSISPHATIVPTA
jgi:hypothetical protein